MLAFASLGVVVASFAWAYATQDFWSDGKPVLPLAVMAGVLASIGLYLRSRRGARAVGLGLAVTILTLFGALIITIGRWEG